MNRGEPSPFRGLLSELADGEKWKLVRGEGWEDFAQSLGEAIGSLDARRGQAIVMVLVAISTGALQASEVEEFLAGRDMDDDAEVDALIAWLRSNHRPRWAGD